MKSKMYGEDVIVNTKKKEEEDDFFYCTELHQDDKIFILFFSQEEIANAKNRAMENKEDYDQLLNECFLDWFKSWFK